MVLLDDVVEIAVIPHHDTLPRRVFLTEHPQCEMARQIAVQIDRARPRCVIVNRLSDKCLCRVTAATRAKQVIDRRALPVNHPVQVVLPASYGDGGFVHLPTARHAVVDTGNCAPGESGAQSAAQSADSG